jgi:hypothetical protein
LTCNTSVFDVTGNNAIIDWIWVEIREDSGDGTTVLESTSALLQADGDIVAPDGVSLTSTGLSFGSYLLVLSHRNHLGIITDVAVNLSGGTFIGDYTKDILLIEGGSNGIADLGDGSIGLYAGDFNGDGQIQISDKNAVEPLRGITGYSNADIDLNSEVQNSDINSYLNPNIGRGEQYMSRSLFAKRRVRD